MLLYNRDAQPWQGSLDSVCELFLCWEGNELTQTRDILSSSVFIYAKYAAERVY